MEKLKNLVTALDPQVYTELECSFNETKGVHYLYLMQSYKKGANDDDIIKELNIKNSTYYVLKTRLYDRIQEKLNNSGENKNADISKKLSEIKSMIYKESRCLVRPLLEKMELECKRLALNNELIQVYDMFKRISYYDKTSYYHYSALYNEQLAYCNALDKLFELHQAFILKLSEYKAGGNKEDLEYLQFIFDQMNQTNTQFNKARMKLLVNIAEMHLIVFCQINPQNSDMMKLIEQSKAIINQLEENSKFKSFNTVITFLEFEYYIKTSQFILASERFEILNQQQVSIALYSDICLINYFFYCKVKFLIISGQSNRLRDEPEINLFTNEGDIFTEIAVKTAASIKLYYKNDFKKAAFLLNEILNIPGINKWLHLQIEIKILLSYFYYLGGEMDYAFNVAKNIIRKIKSIEDKNYDHVLYIFKYFEDMFVKMKKDAANGEKLSYFLLKNKNSSTPVLNFFTDELNSKLI